LQPTESHCEGPPEPGLARREAHEGEGNARATPPTAGSRSTSQQAPARKEGAHGGTRGSPVSLAVPGVPELGVGAFVLHELVVGAQLGEEPLFDDGDAVGVVRGVQTMGDRDDRSAL